MKLYTLVVASIGFCMMLSFNSPDTAFKNDCSKFLAEAADARMMNLEVGKLAVTKGTTNEIKIYGKLMVQDQTLLLAELKKLAQSKKILLPAQPNEEKMKTLVYLKEIKGKDFDKKLLGMMKDDHKKDVKFFKDASGCTDKQIKAFAAKHLPMIESHLGNAEKIKEEK